jgi:hypothetical protein
MQDKFTAFCHTKCTVSHLNIPVGVIDFVLKNKLQKPFEYFIYLKAHCSGQLHSTSPVWQSAKIALDIKDNRTIKGYLQTLMGLNWIGHNPKSGYYFIRSFGAIRKKHSIKNCDAAVFDVTRIESFTSFLPGAIICHNIYKQKKCKRAKGRGLKPELKNLKGSNQAEILSTQPIQPRHFSSPPNYFGISNARIAKLLHIKETHARDLKHAAENAGFLRTIRKIDEFFMDAADHNWRANAHPELAKRLSFVAKKIKSTGLVSTDEAIQVKTCFLIQRHDEIIPLLRIKKVKPFNRIHVSA